MKIEWEEISSKKKHVLMSYHRICLMKVVIDIDWQEISSIERILMGLQQIYLMEIMVSTQ